MIIDCRSPEFRRAFEANRRRVFVDGVEIHHVWYVDSEAGFVRTHDVVAGAGPIATRSLSLTLLEWGARQGWDMPLEGVVSRTIRGVVELKPRAEPRGLLAD